MALRRVFVDYISGERALASGPRAHHLARVVRLRIGERVEVSDGTEVWSALAESVDAQTVVFKTVELVPPVPPAPQVELHLALIKLPRFEWAIEKATELGVSTIVPVLAERSDSSLAHSANKRMERWLSIAEEGAQQARRTAAPVIASPAALGEALLRPASVRVLIDFQGQELRLSDVRSARPTGLISVLIGPEGGWTDTEIAAARQAGAVTVTLGRNVLRSETAALAALSAVNQLLRTIE